MSIVWLGALWAQLATAVPVPQYPGAPLTPIGEVASLGDRPLALAYFQTDDGVAAVARYFFRHWTAQGLPTVVVGDGRQEAAVTAFATREGIQLSVVLRRLGRKTLGFSAVCDGWGQPGHGPSSPKVAGELPGILLSQQSASGAGGGRASLWATRSARPVEEIGAALERAGLRRLGSNAAEWEGKQVRVSAAELAPGLALVTEHWAQEATR